MRSGAALSAALAMPPWLRAASRELASFLIPMDESQSDHLKAYGVTFRALQRGEDGEWLLNYRGGSFLLPASAAVQRDAGLAGVRLEAVSPADVAAIHGQIMSANMDAVPLENVPKVAVYAPPNAAPWDDAVTMVLEYSGRHLAMIELASAMKLLLYVSLLATLFVPWGIALPGAGAQAE